MPLSKSLSLVCDLDGVLWHRTLVLDGVREALRALTLATAEIQFVTNNSFTPVSEIELRITELGYNATGRVVTSPMITAALLPQKSRIFCLAGAGTLEMLELSNHSICEWDSDPDFVVIGLRTDFDYDMLKHATLAIRRGATLVATNDDPSYPTDEGILPGCGAIVSAISIAAGVNPTVMGKPNYSAIEFLKRKLNYQTIDFVIGDRLEQDGLFAQRLKSKFLHITDEAVDLSSSVDIPVEITFNSFNAAVDYLLSRPNSNDF